MIRVSLVRTWSGPTKSHRTLQVLTARWFVHVWLHAFERGWLASDRGMLCFGVAWLSFNIFNIRPSE